MRKGKKGGSEGEGEGEHSTRRVVVNVFEMISAFVAIFYIRGKTQSITNKNVY